MLSHLETALRIPVPKERKKKTPTVVSKPQIFLFDFSNKVGKDPAYITIVTNTRPAVAKALVF